MTSLSLTPSKCEGTCDEFVSSCLLFFKPDDSDSSTKMPSRLQFSQPQRSFLATEFHRRRGTRDYKMNHMYLPRKMMVDFSLSAVLFATPNFH